MQHLVYSKPAADWLQNAIDTGVIIKSSQPQIVERKPHEYATFDEKTAARVMQLYYNKSMELTQIAAYLNIPFYHVLDIINK